MSSISVPLHFSVNMLKSALIVAVLALGVWGVDRPVVKTLNGLVRGTYRNSTSGRQFLAFSGIPYAKPPVGDLRLKEPEPKESWTGIWDASTEYRCIQVNHEPEALGIVEGTEDCLYLNVYTPNVLADKLMNVIVHIHGGAFMFGQGSFYGPNHLMDHDVVFITFNYRLGPLGFLSTEDDALPGNNGLKDQVLALKWIQKNIEHFGGNPKSVTITGMSAGGSSVHFHYLSPLSKGLFHRGISLSGTALCNWALVENALDKTRLLGSMLGCGQRSTKDLVECLRQRSPKQITEAGRKFQPWLYNPYTPFGPVVEPKGRTGTRFLSDHPYQLLLQGKTADIPWMTSHTSHEGLYPAADFLYKEDRLPHLEKHWKVLAAFILHFDGTVALKQHAEVAEKIREYYLKGKPISRETYPELVQAIGDRLFVVDAEKGSRLQARSTQSPVYFYKFSYRGDHSFSELLSGTTEDFGTSHADDMMYLSNPSQPVFGKYMESEGDKKLAKIMQEMWLSFAETGVPKMPNVEWNPLSKDLEDKIQYLHIQSPDKLTMEKVDNMGHVTFWDSLPIMENNNMKGHAKDEL